MFYNLVKLVLGSFIAIVFRQKVIGGENIPKEGGVIIAANHVSLWDPPVIGSAISRNISFMAKEELFAIPVFNWAITKLGTFPVRRNTADRNAIRTALNKLADGQVVGLFPEGTRSKDGELGTPEPGIALIAAKAGVPIIPTAVIGTNQFCKNGHIFPCFQVRFGKPVLIPPGRADKDTLEQISGKIMTEIASQLEQVK